MTTALYAPKIVCKICGTADKVTSVMDDTYVTPDHVMQAFTCRCEECLVDFKIEAFKWSNSLIRYYSTQ